MRTTTLATLLTSACSGASTAGLTGTSTRLLDLPIDAAPLAGASFESGVALPPKLPLPAYRLPPPVVEPPSDLSRLVMVVPIETLGVAGPTIGGMSMAESRTTLAGSTPRRRCA
ncbi:hypothetical protein [Enhygromyxa salina]|uniref:Lipoprotein n=1 Tax=Enhygromyxa salina TaxID=215803 RepID=A0A2S9XNK4_9BACT|nr:hypothetical protein [Enhygromyxa salina]PRP94448.1 hypothetical protein ENSA7_77820 [Enhygromyxa salina]